MGKSKHKGRQLAEILEIQERELGMEPACNCIIAYELPDRQIRISLYPYGSDDEFVEFIAGLVSALANPDKLKRG
ncbi:hypothetical protein ES708_19288 [subsurface metagenome]